jgi:hypothetical protein
MMANFGIEGHVHTEAGVCSFLLTLLAYGIKWLFGLRFPESILALPTFMGVFIGFYLVLYVVFLILWSRK